ncbi:transposase [Arachidicoccus soli]|nr:transposase [Arachidicoccus soli]
MYLPPWAQQFKEPRTEIKCIKGAYYKYEVRYQYNKDKKRTDKITVRLLGKITQAEGFIASDKDLIRQQLSELPKVDIKTFGVYHLFSSLLSQQIASLSEAFKQEVVEVLLCFSMMRWAYQSPIKRAGNYHTHDFCSEYWHKRTLSDKKISEALKFIGENREAVMAWMRSQLPGSKTVHNQFVMMDSTHVSSVSENLGINAKGYNPNHDYDKQIRLLYLFAAELKQPVYYRLINGNITDIKSMALCVKEMEVGHVVFIADKGFYSKKNIELLQEQKLHYIIPIHRNNKIINFSPLEKAAFKKTVKTYFAYQDRIIWHYEYQREGQNIVTFLDEKLRVKEESDYLLRIQKYPETHSEDRYYDKLHSFGTLSIVYDLEGSPTPQQLYEAYKQRNEIEVMFDSYKNFLAADKTFMQDRHVLEGWLMANFIAMIAYYKLFWRLKEAKLLSHYAPKDIIELSKSIYQMKINGQWLCSEITEKTKTLFKKIKIDYLK